MKVPELLVPAGNLSKLRIALAYGADAVYVGAAGLSMRPDEASLSVAALEEAVKLTHRANKKIYIGINSLMFQTDMKRLSEWLSATRKIDYDAVILSDPGAFRLVKKLRPEVCVHISTQLSTANYSAVQFWEECGAKRVVLARECSLEDTRQIAEKSRIELEIFIHGAMCVAISGRCLLSAHLCGYSASTGRCKHSCRWEWQLTEEKRPGQSMAVFESRKQTFLMGSADLCLIEHIPAIVESGVDAVKIEGRMKSEYYVAITTGVYRKALDSYIKGPHFYQVDPIWMKELEAVSHRPYSEGFAFGYPQHKPQTLQVPNRPISSRTVVAYVEGVRAESYQLNVKNPFSIGEVLEWIEPNMRTGTATVRSITNQENESVARALSSEIVTVGFDSATEPLGTSTVFRRQK